MLSQVWNKPREYNSLRAEHRHRSHCGPGVSIRVCRCGAALAAHFRNEGGVPGHQEDVLLWCFSKVSKHRCHMWVSLISVWSYSTFIIALIKLPLINLLSWSVNMKIVWSSFLVLIWFLKKKIQPWITLLTISWISPKLIFSFSLLLS